MLTSIIIPNYNGVSYLPACLDSCLSQDQSFVKEIIVVDDNSTDDSWAVLNSYVTRHPDRIKIYRNTKKGAQSARNLGFEKSSGIYIQYLDSDDILSENKISNQLTHCNKKAGTVFSCYWLHFNSQPEDAHFRIQPIDRNYKEPLQYLADSWNGGGMGNIAIWLTPRSIIEKVGPWNECLLKNQDGEFFCRVLLNAEEIVFVPNAIAYYRKPTPKGKNISKRVDTEAIESLLYSYRLCHQSISASNSCLNHDIKKALARQYSLFIYEYYMTNPDLAKKALGYIKELGYNPLTSVGGARFQHLAKIVGLVNAVKFKAHLSLIYNLITGNKYTSK